MEMFAVCAIVAALSIKSALLRHVVFLEFC